jgi:hypothetical protein
MELLPYTNDKVFLAAEIWFVRVFGYFQSVDIFVTWNSERNNYNEKVNNECELIEPRMTLQIAVGFEDPKFSISHLILQGEDALDLASADFPGCLRIEVFFRNPSTDGFSTA